MHNGRLNQMTIHGILIYTRNVLIGLFISNLNVKIGRLYMEYLHVQWTSKSDDYEWNINMHTERLNQNTIRVH